MSSKLLAIDIQKTKVCSVLLSHSLKGMHTLESMVLPIEVDADSDYFSGLGRTLAQISETIQTNYDKCIVGVPADCFLFRTLELPFKSRKKIEQIIDFELENFLPLAGGDFKTEFRLLPAQTLPGTGVDNGRVSAASIDHKMLERFNAVFETGNISPDIFTVGSGYASAVALAKLTAQEDAFAYLHVEQGLIAFYALGNGEIFFARACGIDSDEGQDGMLGFISVTCLAVNEMLDDGQGIRKLSFSDIENGYGDMTKAIEERTGIPVELFDPAGADADARMSRFFDSGEKKAVQDAAAMAMCDAGGFEIYNFHRKLSEIVIFFQDYRSSLIFTCSLLVCALIVWGTAPFMKMNAAQGEIADLDSRLRQEFQSVFPDVDNIVDPVRQMQVKLDEARKKGAVAIMDDHALNIDLLNEISQALPASLDILFTRFVRTESSLMVTGSADQFNAVDRMKNYFQKIVIFKEVEINSASMDKIENRVKFSMKIIL
ncbi:hypothetical protein [Desulfobacter latus]|uniref:GspL periplasmic domain-containing protein n=1 Tax=Desulfobacter latus TaxID=2292 RepID=A0A850TBM5_9BACT|nr:hypothetical protein [Desulfobacter latus]NWH05637.1 hypothetical protein [Desulfobacter latus]